MIRIQSILTMALLVGATPSLAQPPGDVGPQDVRSSFRGEEGAVPPGLVDVYRSLAASWDEEDAAAIAGLAGGGRVHLVIERAGVRERLSASQLQYMLEELFDASGELVFRFPLQATYDAGSETGYAVGERTFRERQGMDPAVDRVFVAARMERGRWILSELRLAPR